MNIDRLFTKDSRIFIAGHRGMVGSAILRLLISRGYNNIITRSHKELDLLDQLSVRRFFNSEPIDYVVLAAAKVGGIMANNTYRADFIYQNLMIECNVIHEAFSAGVKRLLFLGSSCIYPRLAPQPMKEDCLLSGYLESTNQPYAIAKIAGIELCQSYNRQYGTRYRCIMPTNLYGQNDNYDLENSHVLPALIRKFHLARLAQEGNWKAVEKDSQIFGAIQDSLKLNLGMPSVKKADSSDDKPAVAVADNFPCVVLWGTGSPRREFLHVDDLASAAVFIMEMDDDVYDRANNDGKLTHINIGTGKDLTILELAEIVKGIVGYNGRVIWDKSKPDGTFQKLLDVSLLTELGWKAKISLHDGIRQTYNEYLDRVLCKA